MNRAIITEDNRIDCPDPFRRIVNRVARLVCRKFVRQGYIETAKPGCRQTLECDINPLRRHAKRHIYSIYAMMVQPETMQLG